MTPQQRFDRRFYAVVSYLLNVALAGYLIVAYSAPTT